MDWKEISNLSLYTDAEKERAKRDNIALNSPPIDHTQLPREILTSLPSHYSNWSLQTGNINIRELRASDTVKLFEKNGKDWISVRTFGTGAVLGQTAYALSRRSLRAKPNMGGGQGTGYPGTSSTAIDNKQEEQLVPTVNINTPPNGTSLKLTDKKYILPSFKDYTFKAGDTVSSVTKQITGESNPDAIYNYNSSFTSKRPPQEYDSVRIATGQALAVKGTVKNASRVTLAWKSEKGSNGSLSTSVEQGGKNQSRDWEIKIDQIQPGDYTLTAQAGSASHSSKFIIEEQHWLRLLYNDENGKPIDLDLDYEIRFEDGSGVRGRLKNGSDYIVGIPFLPFTIEFLPGDEKKKELDKLYQQLDELLTQEIANTKAQSAPLKKQWEQHPWYMKHIVADLYLKKGAILWAWDTLKGIWTLVSGVVTGVAKTAAWVAEFQLHKEMLFIETVSGDKEGIKRESEHLKKMLTDVGDDVSEITDMAETLYYLAHDDRIGPRLKTFAENYFDALSVQERHEFVSRYGIDIALIFVGGSGAVLLGVKNAAKISKILTDIANLLKLLRLKLSKKLPDVDKKHTFSPKTKKVRTNKFNLDQDLYDNLSYNGKNPDSMIQDALNLKKSNPAYKNLSDEEMVSLHAYTGSYYRDMNLALRTGDPNKTSQVGALNKHAANALTKLQKNPDNIHKGAVYRGVSMTDADIAKRFPDKGVHIDKGFMSTSSNPNASFTGNVNIITNSKSGVKVDGASQYAPESEVLFRPGTKFSVLDKSRDGNGNWTIILDEI